MKTLQTADNIFMTEWVAIFRESGLRDDVTVKNLQDACLKLVVLARARDGEFQVDQQVERAQQPLSAQDSDSYYKTQAEECSGIGQTSVQILSQTRWMQEWRTIASMRIRALMVSVCDVAPSHIISRLVLVHRGNSLLDQTA